MRAEEKQKEINSIVNALCQIIVSTGIGRDMREFAIVKHFVRKEEVLAGMRMIADGDMEAEYTRVFGNDLQQSTLRSTNMFAERVAEILQKLREEYGITDTFSEIISKDEFKKYLLSEFTPLKTSERFYIDVFERLCKTISALYNRPGMYEDLIALLND